MRFSRLTGAGAGLIVLLLGAWAGIIPFVGPYFHYGFTPDATWHFTLDRLWLDILPAAAVVLGGLAMIGSSRRPSGLLGSWLALLGGVWLLLGPSVSLFWTHAAPGVLQSGIGAPLGGHDRAAVEMIGFFYGAGALITMLSIMATGTFVRAVPVARARAGVAEGAGRAAPAEGAHPAGAAEGARPAAGADGAPAEEAPRRRGLIRGRRRRGAVDGERMEGARRS